MPLYEYKCNACEQTFEELARSAAADDQRSCPHCQNTDVTRQPSVFATHQGQSRSTPPAGPCGSCCQPDGGCPFAQ